jgi:hypothetical protein
MTRYAVVLLLVLAAWADSECVEMPNGRPVTIEVRSCREIVGKKGEDALKTLYTGALVTDNQGSRWMYPSAKIRPCKDFPPRKTVKKRAYYTCCDTGHWGKCAYDGKWLGDLDGKPLNVSQ